MNLGIHLSHCSFSQEQRTRKAYSTAHQCSVRSIPPGRYFSHRLFPGSNSTSGAAQSKLSANACLYSWSMSFPLPLQPVFASNGFSASLFKAQVFPGASECFSALDDAVDFQEQQDSLQLSVEVLFNPLSCTYSGDQRPSCWHRGYKGL